MSSTDFAIRSSRQSSYGAQDDRPLTEQEMQLVQRLLSDPFSFPLQFKSWLVSYLETSDMNLPMSAVNGLQKTLGISGAGQGTLGIFPAGLILPYGGDTAPEGSLLCDGALYTQTNQARLFAAIGYRFGGSGGSFNVPDLRERIPVGKGTMAAHDTIGKTEGAALGSRGTAHHHTIPMSSDGSVSGGYNVVGTDHAPDGTGATNAPNTPTNTPAFVTLNFIIVN